MMLSGIESIGRLSLAFNSKHLQNTKRAGDDEVLSGHSDPITAQVDEEHRLLAEKNRLSARPSGPAPSSG